MFTPNLTKARLESYKTTWSTYNNHSPKDPSIPKVFKTPHHTILITFEQHNSYITTNRLRTLQNHNTNPSPQQSTILIAVHPK